MATTDFFDDDLMEKHIDSSVDDTRSVPPHAAGNAELSRMEKHRAQIEGQVAQTSEELERLRLRQDTLERERKALQDLRERQDEYETVRAEMIENLGQTIPVLEREEVKIEQVAELVSITRTRFKALLTEVEELDAENWGDEIIRDEMGKALAIIEETRIEFRKSMSKLDSMRNTMIQGDADSLNASMNQNSPISSGHPKSFAQWIGIGFAVSLPMILFIMIMSALAYVFFFKGLI